MRSCWGRGGARAAGRSRRSTPSTYREELVFEHVGEPYLLYRQESFEIADGAALHFERGFLRPGATPGSLELCLAHPLGLTEVAHGDVRDGTIELAASANGIGHTDTGSDVTGLFRRYRVEGDTLTYALDMATASTPMTRHLDATPAEGDVNREEGPSLTRLWLFACLAGLLGGAVLAALDEHDAANAVWAATTVLGGVPVLVGVIRSIAHREAGVDVIAIVAIIGCLALQEYFAGAVLAVMLASGQALEDYADRRAHRELSALLARAPQQVHRYEDGDLQTRDIDEVVLGDRLFVKTGEVVPVDGVLEGDAILDESALTGESRPVERPSGDLVRSGAVNAGPAFDLHATATAADSTYAGIVRLVEAAELEKAPAVRLADQYALWFIPITLVIAGRRLGSRPAIRCARSRCSWWPRRAR